MTNVELLQTLQRIQNSVAVMKQILDVEDLKKQGEATMVDPKIAEIASLMDAATNAIAARIQRLIDAGGLSPESEAVLRAEVANLQALGQDPNNVTAGVK